MKRATQVRLMGATLIAFGLLLVGTSRAGNNKQLRGDILTIADKLENGDVKSAKAMAKTIAKKLEYLDETMQTFGLRIKKGIGVGAKPQTIRGEPDGIELLLKKWSLRAPAKATLQKHKSDLIKMAYISAAVGEIAAAFPPEKESEAKLWHKFSEDMHKGVTNLVTALKADNPAEFKKAASKLNNSCNNCHAKFK